MWYFIFKVRPSFFTLQQQYSKRLSRNEQALSNLIFTVAQLAVASHMAEPRVGHELGLNKGGDTQKCDALTILV